MADPIATGYPDMTTAAEAEQEVQRRAEDLIIQPDAVAVIVCDPEGKHKVTANHDMVGGGPVWSMFWGLLFGVLFFVPIVSLAVGAGLGRWSARSAKPVATRSSRTMSARCSSPAPRRCFWSSRRSRPTGPSRRSASTAARGQVLAVRRDRGQASRSARGRLTRVAAPRCHRRLRRGAGMI